MICTFCGHNNDPGVKFCARCGAQIQQNQQSANPANTASPAIPAGYDNTAGYGNTPGFDNTAGYGSTPDFGNAQGYGNAAGFDNAPGSGKKGAGVTDDSKKLPIKKILIIAIPVVIIIIAAIIIIPMLGGSGSSRKDYIGFFSDRDETIISGNNNAKFSIDGDYFSSQVSMDGSKAVVLVDYDFNYGGSLWFVTPSESLLIADDVYTYTLADSGNGVAYFTDYDSKNDLATLYLYSVPGKKATLITEYAYYDGDNNTMQGVALSPDGKSIGYISDYDEQNFEFTGYIKIDGKAAEKLGDEMFALAISNSGKYLYYCKLDVKTEAASLHVRSGRNEFRLISDLNSAPSIMLNKDYSEILFNADTRTFISRRGGERERIGGDSIYALIMPRGSQVKRGAYNDFASITVYGISSFSNFVARTEGGLAYYDNKLESNKISNSDLYAYSAEISSDGKTLYYITNSQRLSSINPTVSGAERVEIEKNILSFIATTDGKSVYYVNDEAELYFYRGSGNPTRIADEVYSGSLVISYNGNKVFFLVDYRNSIGGELYFSNNGNKRTRVSGADEVTYIWSTPANIFYVSRDYELFRSDGSEKFSRFHDEIDDWYFN